MSHLPYRTPAAPPKTRLPILSELTIKTPCKVSWESMEGDERTRFCFSCSKHVHDLSAMTEDEAESFLAVHLDDEDACVRLYRRPDGRVLTSDCPTGAKKRHRRQVAVAASAAAVAITAVSAVVGDLDVPRAHSPLHDMPMRFEPPRLIPGSPIRASIAPVELPSHVWEGSGQGFGNQAQAHESDYPRSPLLRQGPVEVNGAMPPEVISRIVRQNFGRFRLCYEEGLRRDKMLQGRVITSFVIGRDGAVSTAADAGSDIHDQKMVGCVTRAIGNLSFPMPERGVVKVKYPVIFIPAD